MKNRFESIREWAQERNLYEKGDVKTQALKLFEEAGELARAAIKNDEAEFIDAIGDMVVVLTNLSELGKKHFNNDNISIEYCIDEAYKVISKRKGKMINGTFVKESDLNKQMIYEQIEKPVVKAYKGRSWWNMPFIYSEINNFFDKNILEIDDKIIKREDIIRAGLQPGQKEGRPAFIYFQNFDEYFKN